MKIKNFLIFLSILTITKIKSDSIEISFRPSYESKVVTTVYIGTPPKQYHLQLNTGTVYSWIFNSTSESRTYKEVPCVHKFGFGAKDPSDDDDFPLFICMQEKVTIATHTLDLNLALIQNSTVTPKEMEGIDGVLGVGFDYGDVGAGFSIVEKLYEDNIINDKTTSIKINDEYTGYLYFGFKESGLDNLHKGSCSAKFQDYKRKWNCQSSIISFEDGVVIDNDIDILFDTSIEYLVVPEGAFNKIKNKFFPDLEKNSECILTNDGIFQIIKCTTNRPGKFKNIDFTFDTVYKMIFPKTDYFSLRDLKTGRYNFRIYTYSPGTKESSTWIVGQCFLKNFFTIFDRGAEKVWFHSVDYLKNNNSKRKEVFIAFGVIALFLIAFNFFIYYLSLFLARKNYKIAVWLYDDIAKENKKREMNQEQELRDSTLPEQGKLYANSLNNNSNNLFSSSDSEDFSTKKDYLKKLV